ncbi:hypothetical protein [Bacillus altitudinis]
MLNSCFIKIFQRKAFYFAILIGCTLSGIYFFMDVYPNIKYGQISPYTSWIESTTGSAIPGLFFTLMPILAALPAADIYRRDVQTGNWNFIATRGKKANYFFHLFTLNFLAGGIVVSVSLLFNIYLSFMTMPNIPVDPLISGNIDLVNSSTLFPDFYYQHPFLHMLFYVFLSFIFAGVFANIGLAASLFINKSFIVILIPFIVSNVWNYIGYVFKFDNYIPKVFLVQDSSYFDIQVMPIVITFLILFVIPSVVYIYGVKKFVIR